MDAPREESAAQRPAEDPLAPLARAVAPAPRGRRHAGRAPIRSTWDADPGLALVFGSVAFGVVGALALVLGWPVLLLLIVFLQVFLARAWTDYLELPGAVPAAIGILVVAAVADVGVLVARLVDDADLRATELLALAPALGVTFLVAVLVQLARRDGRPGTLAGLVAVSSGGVLAVGLALWLPLEASPAGPPWVAVGFAAGSVVGIVAGGAAWIRQTGRVAGPALLLPLLLALLAGPFYVLGRVVAG